MTYVLVALGSMGDVRPQLALARALQDQGAEALVVGLDDYADTCKEADVPFTPMRVHTMEPIRSPVLARVAAGNQTVGAVIVRRWLAANAERIAAVLDDVVAPGDDVVSGLLSLPACRLLSEHRGCALAELMLAPTLPTAYGASLVGAPRPGRSAVNRPYSWSLRRAALSVGAPIAAALRRRLPSGLRGTGRTRPRHRTRVLLGCSRQLVPPAPDWKQDVVITGHLRMPGAAFWQPPQDLTRFLTDGDPPVFIGFGSVPLRDPVGAVEEQARAVARIGLRAVLQPAPGFTAWDAGWGEHVHVLRRAPHEWLLPRTTAAIHHGGAGTTHAALAAGVPQGVIPFSLDQPYFARRVAALGLGPGDLDLTGAHGQGLERLLHALTAGPKTAGYQGRARRFSALIAQEDGAARAADVLLGG